EPPVGGAEQGEDLLEAANPSYYSLRFAQQPPQVGDDTPDPGRRPEERGERREEIRDPLHGSIVRVLRHAEGHFMSPVPRLARQDTGRRHWSPRFARYRHLPNQ